MVKLFMVERGIGGGVCTWRSCVLCGLRGGGRHGMDRTPLKLCGIDQVLSQSALVLHSWILTQGLWAETLYWTHTPVPALSPS
ncbi:hypothetical protein E2C01_087078 [Portunus trituberculatus]|uniref:Uncharacterized protein n=1 Tax=Portunus trituberculatus TaxID=210409 RepID=A0A5B7J5K6_PORTR|nr:hypothetical protein [Portunus trituberculatus]